MPVINAQRLRVANDHELAFIEAENRWSRRARLKQLLPVSGWSLCVVQAGRGFGKTLVGSNWVRRQAGLYPGCVIHVIAPTYGDLRGVVFGGPSGLINMIPHQMVASINNSIFEIRLINGSIIKGFSAESPDRLRGPQAHFTWGDEAAAWNTTAEAVISNIDLSTRLFYTTVDNRRVQPQRLYTTTPRPLDWLKDMLARRDVKVVVGTTMENRANLAEAFFDELQQYEGTQIYRQEVLGELLEVGEAAIIKRSWLQLWTHDRPLPWFDFVFVSLDTALTEKTFDKKDYEPDFTACTVWGVFPEKRRWNMMMLECWHEQIGFPELIKRAKQEMKARYGRRRDLIFRPVVGEPQYHEQIKTPDLLIIEDKGSGISLRQTLQYEGVDSWPYNPGRADKLSRLHGVSHVASAGRIWLPESKVKRGEPRSWCEPFLKEVTVYSGPGTTRNDDFVDSFSQAVRYFADRWLTAGVTTGVTGEFKDDSMELEVDLGENQALYDSLHRSDAEVRNPYD
jgi:phage terminase large subunit-like protein